MNACLLLLLLADVRIQVRPVEAHVVLAKADDPVTRPSAAGVTTNGAITLDVPEGEYQLIASASGHALATRRVRVSGERRSEVTIELRPAQMVTGRVVDAAGKPIAGARVRSLQPAFAPSTETDANGAWSLPKDALPVRIEARGYAPATGSELQVTLQQGGMARIHADREEKDVRIGLWSGGLHTADDSGGLKSAAPLDLDALAPGTYRIVARAADPRGFVERTDLGTIDVIAGGVAEARVQVPKLRPAGAVTTILVKENPDRFEAYAPQRVAHNTERAFGGTLVHIDAADAYLVSPATIATTTVTSPRANLKLRLVAPEGTALPRSGVAMFGECGHPPERTTIPFAIAGNVVEIPAPSSCRAAVLRFDPFEPLPLARFLPAGKTTDLGEHTLRAAASVEARVVSEPAMDIVPRATLRVLVAHRGPETVIAEAVAGADGRAVLTGLPAEVPLVIEARVPGTERSASVAITLDPGARATLDPLAVPRAAKLVVQPRLAERFRSRFPEARLGGIALRSQKGVPEIRRDAQVEGGKDIVFDDLRPGTYQLLAIVSIPDNTQPIELALLELTAGEERRVDAVIDPLVFHGRVTSAGAPVEVQLSVWGDLGGRPARSKPTGELAIILPHAGRYTVEAAPAGTRGRMISLGTIDFSDPAQPVELRMPQAAVDVDVVSGGRPAGGVLVLAQLQNDGDVYVGSPARASTDANGRARVESLLEGRTWLFEARDEATGRVAEKALVVRGNERVTLELAEPVTIAGAVRGASETPRVFCLYLNADNVPRLVAAEEENERYEVKLASAANVRCGVRAGGAIAMFTRGGDFTMPPADETGTLVITDWRHTSRTRNAFWLVNAEGQLFNLDWIGGGAGSAPAPLTIDAVPAGRWRIVHAQSLANLAALARGTTIGLKDVATVTIAPGEKQEVALRAWEGGQ